MAGLGAECVCVVMEGFKVGAAELRGVEEVAEQLLVEGWGVEEGIEGRGQAII